MALHIGQFLFDASGGKVQGFDDHVQKYSISAEPFSMTFSLLKIEGRKY